VFGGDGAESAGLVVLVCSDDRYLRSVVQLMVVLARACGHHRLSDFELDDLATFDRDFAYLSGVPYAGAVSL
jgi:hypothetical protein